MVPFFNILFRAFMQHKVRTLLLLAALAVELAYETFMPLSFKFIVDYSILPKNYNYLVIILVTLVTLALSSAAIGVARDYMYAGLGSRIMIEYYNRMYEKLQRLSMDFFYRVKGGDIVSRFNTDLVSIDSFVMLIPYALLSLLGLALNIGVLFALQWQLALLAVVGLPLCLVGPKLFGGKAFDTSYALKEEQANISTVVQENVGAQAVVKAFGLQQIVVERFRSTMAKYWGVSTRANFYTFLIDRTTNMGTMILNLMTICIGAVLCYNDYLSVGSLLAFSAILISLSYLVAAITWLAPQLLQAAAGMKRVQELLSEEPTVGDDASGELPPFEREIAFRGVTFAYEPGQTSLNRLDLSIPKGTYTAFVGASGSGKSTVINMLMRFYDPQEGAVLYDGHNIRHVSQASLRAQIGIVFQDSFLFQTTIRENIRLGKPGATDEEVEKAAKAAEIHSFILSLPEGYETNVGERGSRLSGGQRQRVAIARAIIRDPAILILDEATSALDPSTEAAINETLHTLAASRTVISITHRLASAEKADRIFVLERGGLIEQGTHAELLAKPEGVYRQAWKKQNGFQFSEDGYHVDVVPERLKQFPILAPLDDALLGEVAHYFVTESHAKGRTVIHEGDPGDKFYVIVRGKVEVLKAAEDGTPAKVAELTDGDYFGEVALLRQVPRTATIRTATPVVFLTLQREFFQFVLQKAPHLAERFVER